MSVTSLAHQLMSALQKHPVFSVLEGETLARLVQELEMVSFAIGETILREGEPGDCAYLVYAGKVRVFKEGPLGRPVTLATLAAGDLFGEHAILQDQARTASVRASEDAVLFRIPRAAFANLLLEQPKVASYLQRLLQKRALHRFLQMATVLGAVPAKQVLALLDQFEECTFPIGHVVCREGEAGDRMYIIQGGEAKVVKGTQGSEAVLTYLGQADYFGERALILNEPRYASIVALTDLACFSLRRESFEQLRLSAPQLQAQLTRRLEQYPLAEELARKFGAKPPVRADEAPSPSLPEPIWEKLADEVALPQAPLQLTRRWSWLGLKQRFPFIPQQEETDCGAASLAMIACYYNVPMSVERLRDLTQVGAEGASMLSLTKAAEAIGFQWRAVSTDYQHLGGLALPAIAHWNGYHYLVLYALDGDNVVLGDPALGLVKLTRRAFETAWTGGLLLLTPTADLLRHAPLRTGWQCLWPSLQGVRGALVGAFLLSTLLAVLLVAFAVLTQLIVDSVLRRDSTAPFALLIAGGVLVGVCLGAALLLRQFLLRHILQRLSRNLTADWFDRLLRLPWRYFLSRPLGALLVRLENRQEVQSALARLTLATLLNLLLLVAGLVMVFTYNVTLGLIALAPLVLTIGLLVLVTGRQQASTSITSDAAARSAWLEAIHAVVALKDAAAETHVGGKHRALQSHAGPLDSDGRLRLLLPGVSAAHAIASIGALWYGGNLVAQGQLTVGQLVALQGVVSLMALPVLGLAVVWPQVLQFRRLCRDVAESEATAPEQQLANPPQTLPRLRGFVRFEEVAFRHRPENRDVLANITLEVQPGQILWVVGRMGAGKTTLALLLQRLLLPTAGKITVEGVDLATVELRSLRAQVSLITEEPVLVDGTIRDNIALAEPGAALERVIGAAKLANAHDFVMRFPHGYDTRLGALGVQLSRGQRQALCIARALLKEPRLLILDEATAALDAESERAVLKNLRWLSSDRTTLVLTRRPMGMQPNDRVVVLEDGQIVEQGDPGTLLKQKGLFCYLAAQQVNV